MTYKIGILGATGAVGQEIIELLNIRQFPYSDLKLLASARSAGKTLNINDQDYVIEEVNHSSFEDLDICIFSAGSKESEIYARSASESGCIVIDNSSAFRMDESVPLVVPEINPDDAFKHNGIISNPNCTTAITLMGLYPLHKAFHLKSFIASTYQAVSGSGVAALKELDNQISAEINNEDMIADVYPHPIAFNLIPHVDSFDGNGNSKEELKLLNESRKILNNQNLNVNCTCVRVPVRRAHSISVTASFNNPVDLKLARKQIQDFPNVDLLDKPQEGIYPMPIHSSRNLNCSVGRLRLTSVVENGLSLWISGDQLWKGAALNAIQIAELIISKESS